MADESIQCHDDPTTCDTVSSVYVPIIFVPGVMGSRLDIIAGRTWDPDDKAGMASTWVTYQNSSNQKTRRALRAGGAGAPGTPASTKRKFDYKLFGGGYNEVYKSTRCRAIGQLAAGEDDKTAIGDYYGTDRNWASVAWGFYGTLLVRLESELNLEHDDPRFPVYACGFDWRQPNELSGPEINTFIRKVLAKYSAVASDVIVITHSMGGLAVRGGMQADPSIKSSIRGVIHGLQPSLGAVTCYRRFMTGTSPPCDSGAIPDRVLNSIIGTEAAFYAYNLSGCPGPLQLLPNHVYSNYGSGEPWLKGLDTMDLSGIYDMYRDTLPPGIVQVAAAGEEQTGSDAEKASHSVRADLTANLHLAEAFHKAVETTAHPRTYVIYSTGRLTDSGIEFLDIAAQRGGSITAPPTLFPPKRWETVGTAGTDLKDVWNDVIYMRSNDGDGTVPGVSARCPALDPPALEPGHAAGAALEHSKAYGDADFQTLTLSYVHRLLTPD